ncbi:MAG: large conductance mechanosensitive channel protein MscL [Lachnospiraceae bacterium]|nr:large conductance mechanosensitive channel protein MscL [Lachnospiraceae bacterium]
MSGKKPAFLNEFKEFITRGNVLDMAVGIIIGGAFTAIVNSLVNDILNPFINTIFGGFGFDGMNIVVKLPWVTLMRNMGMAVDYPVFAFGNFISAVITFLITALALFFLVKGINALRKLSEKKKAEEETAAPTTKMCPYCRTEIDIEATRCPHCTSQL